MPAPLASLSRAVYYCYVVERYLILWTIISY